MDFYKKFISELYEYLGDTEVYGAESTDDLKRLVKIENDFASILKKSKKGMKVYSSFISHISDELKDTRISKIYFRERDTASPKIYLSIKTNNPVMLSKFRLNFKFIKWAMDKDIPEKKRLQKIYEEIIGIRHKILNDNLPLVINRSKIFQIKAKKNNIEYLDFIQIATEGFMVAIDKFTPPEYQTFKSVAIGWMTNKMTDLSNGGIVKLTSQDKRILYRANLARYKNGIEDFDKILLFVRSTYPTVTPEQLSGIMASRSELFSVDISGGESDKINYNNWQAESNVEEDEIYASLRNSISEQLKYLDTIQFKIVVMKTGVKAN